MTGSEEVPSSPEHRYFRAIEAVFVRLRGAPLLLSSADWQIASDWHQREIPLALIETVLENLFERRRLRATKGKVQSLRYCANAVESAWAEVESLSAPLRRRELEPLDLEARLSGLADSLPVDLADRSLWQERILQLIGSLIGSLGTGAIPGGTMADPEGIERALADLDGELLETVERSLSEQERQQLAARADAILAGLATRDEVADLGLARKRLMVRQLRSQQRIPVLSLFSPAATESEPEE